jgi:hypothetical protein
MKRFLLALTVILPALLLFSACNDDDGGTYAVRYSLEYTGDVDLTSITYTDADGSDVVVNNPASGFEEDVEVDKGFVARFSADGTLVDGEVIIRMRVRKPAQDYVLEDSQNITGTTIPITVVLEETL